MKLIRMEPNPSGGYPSIQSGSFSVIPSGMAIWPDELSTDMFYEYNGFVTLNISDKIVTDYKPNVEMWEKWKSSLPPETEPEPEPPTTEERLAAMEAAMLTIMMGG